MRKIFLTALFALVIFMPTSYALAKEVTTVMNVSGMTCSTCPITIRHFVLKMKGVSKAVVVLDSATATVTYEDTQQSAEAIARAITKFGYPTVLKKGAE